MKKVLCLFVVVSFVLLGTKTLEASSSQVNAKNLSKEVTIPVETVQVQSWEYFISGFSSIAPDDIAEAMADHYQNLLRACEKGQYNLFRNSLRCLTNDLKQLESEIENPMYLIVWSMLINTWESILASL